MSRRSFQFVPLGTLATFSQGFQVPLNDQVSSKTDDSFVRFIRIVDYTQNTKDVRYIKDPGNKYFVSESDITMVRYGAIGVIGRGKAGVIANNIFKVTPNDDQLDKRFLYYSLLNDPVQDKIKAGNSSTTMPAITFGIAADLPIPKVSLSTQRKIASILSSYDDLIQNNTRRIAILEEMAQAIHREWFLNFRFPGHENVKLVDSPLGQIPEGWEVVKMKDVSDIKWGDTKTTKKSYVEEGYDAYSAAGKDGMLDHFDFDRDGVVLSAIGANCGRTWFASGKWSCIKNTIRFWSTSDRATTAFLFYATYGKEFWPKRGAAQPFISQTDAKNKMICVPTVELAGRFHEYVDRLLRQIDSLDRKNENLRSTRDLLLPKLISGKLDVEDLDIDAGLITDELQYEEPPGLTDEDHEILDGIWDEIAEEDEDAKTNKRPISIEDVETDRVMAEFRQESRKLGSTTRADLIKAVSRELGYRRLGSNIEDVLKGHLRAAVRRKIIGANGDEVWPETPTMDAYNRDELIDTFKSVMRKNQEYERDDVIRALANYLGFRRLTESVREPIKSAINGAIRRDVLSYQGDTIWREE